MMLLVLLCGALFGATHVEGGRKVCFAQIGCFSNTGPFYDVNHRPFSRLPESPGQNGLTFLLFSRDGPAEGWELKTGNASSLTSAKINGSLPFKFVTHGFRGFGKTASYLKVSRSLFTIFIHN